MPFDGTPPNPKAQERIAQLVTLKRVKDAFEKTFRQIRSFIQPIAGSFEEIDARGRSYRHEILDNTGEGYSEELVAAIIGFVANQGTKWLGLRTSVTELNEQAEVSQWLERVATIILQILDSPDSRFYSVLARVIRDKVDFGTGVMWIAERAGKIPLFQHVPMSQIYLGENEDGELDVFFRKFQYTARQAFKRWGNKLPKEIQDAANDPKKSEDLFWFLHVHQPRNNGEANALRASQLPYESTWIAVAAKQIVAEGGTNKKSMIGGRWWIRDVDVYGRGPGHKALADVKMLQRTTKSVIRGAEKRIDPPTIVADEGILSPVRGGARGITVVKRELLINSRQSPIQAFPVNSDPQLGEAFSDAIRVRVARAYYSHLIQLSQDPRMTATQVLKIDERTLKTLGPFLGNIQSELLGPAIERVFDIGLRAGFFPPLPAALEEARIEVEYDSPIARAQKLQEGIAVAEFFDLTARIREVDPDIDDNMDLDAGYRLLAERTGVPRALLRDPRVVKERRDARAEVREQQAQIEQIQALAPAAQSATQALSAVNQNSPGAGAPAQAQAA